MKTSACFAVCMAVATFLSAHAFTSPDFLKCRDYGTEWGKNFSTIQLIEHDLVNATWTATAQNGSERNYLFTQEGLLQILSTDAHGNKSYQSTFWRVAEFDNQPFLVLSDDHRKEKLLEVAQTCEGLTLIDVVSKSKLLLDYQPLKSSPKLNLARAYMVGEWTNVTAFETTKNNSKAASGYLNYRFSADGLFTCEFGDNKEKVIEKGAWEISKDGQFLLLHISAKDDIETITGTAVIRIAQVDDHGLVLEQVMKTSSVNEFFEATNKTFAFIK